MTPTEFSGGISFGGAPIFPSGIPMATGKVFWVNSAKGTDAHGQGSGGSTRPFKTLAYAVSQTSSGRGDTIIVLPGHTENTTGITFSQNDLTIVGLGRGARRPAITLITPVGSTFTVSGNGVTFRNMIFDLTGVDAITTGFTVTGADFVMEECRVIQAVSARQATTAFTLSGARPRFFNVTIDSEAAAGADSAICTAAAVDRLHMENCIIRGDFATACIVSSSTFHLTFMYISNCHLQNNNGTGKKVMSLTTSSTGAVRFCSFKGNTWATVADGFSGSMNVGLTFFQCFGFDDTTGGVNAVLAPAAGTVA